MDKNLSSHEAARLLEEFGPNTLTATRRYTLLGSLAGQLKNLLILLLLAAGVVSYLLGETLDAVFIVAIVILNAGFGVYQEFKAERVLDLLKRGTVTLVRVVRDGREQVIDSQLLVPGDLIYLEEGSHVPADATVQRSWNLEVNEASLSGESLPVAKQAGKGKTVNLFMGTVVAKGRGYAHVTTTGNGTRFGQISTTLATIADEPTPLQKKLAVFTRQIGLIGIGAACIVFLLSFSSDESLFESALFAVSLAVAAIPEGLPAVLTITLAIGVERMSKQKAIVRKLTAIEALGSITLVATDKTGTLTTNEMRVHHVWVDGASYRADARGLWKRPTARDVLLNGILCSTASLVMEVEPGQPDVIGDTTEGALLLLARDAGLDPMMIRGEWKLEDEEPFSPATKRMTVRVAQGKTHRTFTKGSPEVILDQCTELRWRGRTVKLTVKQREAIELAFATYARQGLRMLAFAEGKCFLGFVGIADPVRPEVALAVRQAQAVGIRVIMLTGDSPLTAEAIALETGIIRSGEEIITGDQIDAASDVDLRALLPKVAVFARISPEHKLRLVQLFRENGDIVAVTGDGVNDVLAMKQADVSVAMGLTGTDVAKAVADMVITDDNFASLIQAVEQGRAILSRIQAAIRYLLIGNLGEMLYIVAAVTFGMPLFIPLQILYINLLTDGLPALSFAFAPHTADGLKRPPRTAATLLEPTDVRFIAFTGFCIALLATIAVWYYHDGTGLMLAFSVIVFAQSFVLMSLWQPHQSIRHTLKELRRPIFLVAFLLPFALQIILLNLPFLQPVFQVQPLTAANWAVALVLAALILIPLEVWKSRHR